MPSHLCKCWCCFGFVCFVIVESCVHYLRQNSFSWLSFPSTRITGVSHHVPFIYIRSSSVSALQGRTESSRKKSCGSQDTVFTIWPLEKVCQPQALDQCFPAVLTRDSGSVVMVQYTPACWAESHPTPSEPPKEPSAFPSFPCDQLD